MMQRRQAEKSGYEKIYDWVVESLSNVDLQANAEPLGLKVHPRGGVMVSLFGQDYLVNKTGAWPMDGDLDGRLDGNLDGRLDGDIDKRKADFNRRSLAAHYAASPGRGKPSMTFVKLNALADVPEGTGEGSFAKDAFCAPLARKFGSDPSGLKKAVERLGGFSDNQNRPGSHGYIFFPFPLMPLKLVFHEADEEFEAEFSVLYDSRGKNFFQFEALAFLGAVLVEELLKG
jgi:hypothetical protein